MRATLPFALASALSACVPSPAPDNPSPTGLPQVTGTCPSPDPIRDGPLVDAIRADDATSVEAQLARNPGDARARAALVLISGQGPLDENEAACFVPYLT
ncbi:MAG: hypothetical protein AAGE03_14035 [Pseudomonadota bacterium]